MLLLILCYMVIHLFVNLEIFKHVELFIFETERFVKTVLLIYLYVL